MRHIIRTVCLLTVAAAFVPIVRADLYSYFVRSLDWLIDSSDVIVIVEVAQMGKQKVAHTQTVLKSDARCAMKDWPQAELGKLVAELPAGRRLLIFGRLDKDKKPHMVDLFCLNDDTKLPPKMTLLEAHEIAATGGTTYRAQLGVCAVLDKNSKLLTKSEDVLALVKKRVAAGPRLPPDCDRERVEKPYGGDDYGGSFRGAGTPFDTHEVIHHVLVPWEPEYEKGLRKALRQGKGSDRSVAARQLANYKSPKTIAALKACLADDYVATMDEKEAKVSYYPVRAAAYQSLRRLGVEVPEPKLRPEK